ncbi:MAG: response regulator transcription factor [Clostridia bacterium]|nr:response regulator transcription factor [Clostridia bacterium]
MSERICILSSEAAFAQMLRLELEDAGYAVSVLRRDARLPQASVYLVDRDAFPTVLPPASRVVGYGHGRGTDGLYLARPFSLAALCAALRGEREEARGISLAADGTAVYLDGTRIPLSPKEYALLACLVRAGGSPVSRSALLTEVWGEGYGEGVVTVYLHYLRKKLERGGRKLLFAVRGSGYALRSEEQP